MNAPVDNFDDDLRPVGGGTAAPAATPSPTSPLSPPAGAAPSGIAPLSSVGAAGLSSVGGPAITAPAAPTFAPPAVGGGVAPTAAPLRPSVRPEGVEGGKSPNLKAILGSVAAFAVLVAAYFVFRTPPPIPAPAGFSAFAASDNSFECATPQGWNVEPVGKAAGEESGGNGVVMTSGNAKIEVTIGEVTALVGAQLLFGSEPVPEAMAGSRAAGVHKMTSKGLKNSLKGYRSKLQPECPSSMGGVVLKDGRFLPDALLSEYTASGNRFGLGGRVRGYRASLGGRELYASVICQCSERDWKKLKPAFLQVIASVKETRPVAPDAGGVGGMPEMPQVPGLGQ